MSYVDGNTCRPVFHLMLQIEQELTITLFILHFIIQLTVHHFFTYYIATILLLLFWYYCIILFILYLTRMVPLRYNISSAREYRFKKKKKFDVTVQRQITSQTRHRTYRDQGLKRITADNNALVKTDFNMFLNMSREDKDSKLSMPCSSFQAFGAWNDKPDFPGLEPWVEVSRRF